jgi:hypothetical protein
MGSCFKRVEAITPDVLRQAFANWQYGETAPEVLLQLRLMDAVEPQFTYVRDALLYEHIHTLTVERLRFYLPATHLPGTAAPGDPSRQLDAFREAMTYAAAHHRSRAAAWIVLYYRWVLPEGLPPRLMASAAGVSSRQLRRLAHRGRCLLASQLRRAELRHCPELGDNP